jgi:hypothetical protein
MVNGETEVNLILAGSALAGIINQVCSFGFREILPDSVWFSYGELTFVTPNTKKTVRWICHRLSSQGPPGRVGAGCPMGGSDGPQVDGKFTLIQHCTGRDLRAKK